jgi:hypothetical protein
MDEYLKRRKQLLIKLSLSPATIVVGTYATTFGGAFVGSGAVYALGIDPLGGVILGMVGGAFSSGAITLTDTNIKAFQLTDIDRILKARAEQN